MIELYTWSTPNGQKASIMLEEVGLPYRVHPIDIGKDHQFHPDFLAIAPNNKIPAIIDTDNGLRLMESGAILLYLAEKTGRFIPRDMRARLECVQWLFWQMAGLGPMNGQTHHFAHSAPEKVPYAIDRYVRESGRLYAVLDKRLADREYVAGDYSIADIACYPWINPQRQLQDITLFPHLSRWRDAIAARPAVVKAYALVQTVNPRPPTTMSDAERKLLYGQDRTTVR